MNITIRKTAGKYFQIGRYEKGKWILLEHIGTGDVMLELIRLGKEKRGDAYQEPLRIKNL